MSQFTDFLTFEYANAYGSAYDLTKRKQYSEPKIFDAGGDLSKRWYVYFSFRNPSTGKLERQTPIYGGANHYHTKGERLEILSMYRKSLSDFLKKGFNPYEDNTDRLIPKFENPKILESLGDSRINNTTIKESFEKILDIKKNVVSVSSFTNYRSKLKKLEKWLNEKLPKNPTIDMVTKKLIVEYLNEVLARTSPRTRNNTRTELGSLFQVLVDNEIIPVNFIHSINVLKATPERNKTYTNQQQESIYSFLKDNDPILLLFIQFISYNFLRPIEVCRLKVKDVDVMERRIYIRAKNKPVKIKIIPEIMLESIPNLTSLEQDHFLFTPTQIGGEWNATEINRRDYFSKRFRTVVKNHFDLGKEYGLYSFRHTFITKLYKEMAVELTPFEVKSKLMLITGHSSMQALEKYLRDIDAALPEDYSEYFS
ncbi:site-specific integrase [Aureisphaera sp. CAU 1614]|uniref:Site-specific integrase n=1 Tax=Halomarinibacterium sedimenti TaxID=2857106 RepID=A0A9X1JZ18_9FLAO|nr:site-specific integrase [Halomarinibacterium sedimenti]MBW2936796.1 site-specific integrase [Halomarinibacterium sedimenti]